MPFTLTMPKLSPTMEEGTIAKWLKKEGDKIRAGDPLFEVATDKATVEHNALDPGILRKILIKAGQSAIVNQAVAIFTLTADESIEGYQPEGDLPVPKVAVAASAPQETPQPSTGATMAQAAFAPEPPLAQYTFTGPQAEIEERLFASPLAKRLASMQNIDLSTIQGTGPHGRIVQRDVKLGQPNTAVTFGRRELPTLPPGTYEEEPLTPMRKVIGKRLQEAKTFIPHFYVSQTVIVDSLIHLRQELQEAGLKLSYNDFVLRATALALREHPAINSGFNSLNNTLIRFKTIDIAVAVNIPSGLITPIIRHADFKHVGLLSQEMKSLAAKAKEGSLTKEEYKGGSFTISNLGMFGITEFTAIINPPQAAILAVGGIEEKALVKSGSIVVGKTMNLTVSADHRVLDGAEVAQFLNTLKKYLERPSLLLL
jgi:pyruvate dehydrogenase E2 component (dihydrolipoamide acetyltransferase)